MKVLVIGGGIGGLSTALSLHAAGIDVRVYESVAEIKRARRRHQFAAERGARVDRARRRRCVGCDRDRDRGTRLLQQAWPAHLVRAARTCRRLCLAAIFHRSRRPAHDPVRRGRGNASAPTTFLPATIWSRSSRTVRASRRTLSMATASRLPPQSGGRAGRLRRNPLGGADAALSERRTAGVERPYPMARRRRSRAFPDRPHPRHDGVQRPARGGLPDQQEGRRSRAIAHQLGGDPWPAIRRQTSAAHWDRRVSKDRFFHHFEDWNFEWIKFADLICRTEAITNTQRKIATHCRVGVLAG